MLPVNGQREPMKAFRVAINKRLSSTDVMIMQKKGKIHESLEEIIYPAVA
jgi:hypothetical protein